MGLTCRFGLGGLLPDEEDRIALFLDYENLAIGAREALGGQAFDFKPVADAFAERGRVVSRRAYADWSMFEEDRRMLTKHHLELIEIPQRLGASRKNAADIKMAVDAVELAFERDYVTTFVLGTGDSDFTPLVHKLRELNKKVIGVGIKGSTSALLPPACDEFLFYENLEGVEMRPAAEQRGRRRSAAATPAAVEEPVVVADEVEPLEPLITGTLAGLQRSSGEAVLASSLKRAVLRKDSTFSEADYGFRAFGELLRHLEEQAVIELAEGTAKGDPLVQFPANGGEENKAFALLVSVVEDLQKRNGQPSLSGLKNQVRKRDPEFSEKKFGFGGFLQFCKAAATRGIDRTRMGRRPERLPGPHSLNRIAEDDLPRRRSDPRAALPMELAIEAMRVGLGDDRDVPLRVALGRFGVHARAGRRAHRRQGRLACPWQPGRPGRGHRTGRRPAGNRRRPHVDFDPDRSRLGSCYRFARPAG